VEKIEIAGPWITDHEIKYVNKMMSDGWDNYKYVEKFEPAFAEYHQRKHALMTPCCTHAIHLLLLSLGIKEGDEVIVPECTWTATAAPITYQKATPVFADISYENWCILPDSIEKKITKKTKAIFVVDLLGNLPNMEELQSISDKYNIPLLEDAAQALGSTYKGIPAGKFGIASVHSFHRTKTITTGEGGMLLIDDDELFERAKFLRDHGRSSTIPYYTIEASPKYMPSNLQASLGYAQFQRLAELVDRKREIMHSYKKELSGINDIKMNIETKNLFNGAWATSVVFGKSHNLHKMDAMEKLEKIGVPVRPFVFPLSSLPAYQPFNTGSKDSNPNAYDISERGIVLPMAYSLTIEQIRKICDGIKSII